MTAEVKDDLIREYINSQRRMSDSSIKIKRVALQSLADNISKPLDEVDVQDVEDWIQQQRRKNKNSTVNQYLTSIKQFYDWLRDNIPVGVGVDEVRENVQKRQRYKRIQKIRPLEEDRKEKKKIEGDDIVQILSDAKDYAQHHYRFIAIGLIFGMRKGEILNLKTEYIDMREMTIDIPKKLAKTPSAVRSIPIPGWAKPVTKPDGEYWLGPEGGSKPYSDTTFNVALKNNYETQSTGSLYPHRFRITFDTFMIERGVDDYIIKKLMGHKTDQDMTEYYRGESESLEEEKRRVMEEDHYMKHILEEV